MYIGNETEKLKKFLLSNIKCKTKEIFIVNVVDKNLFFIKNKIMEETDEFSKYWNWKTENNLAVHKNKLKKIKSKKSQMISKITKNVNKDY